MNIVYIVKYFPKISESFIINELVELKKRGHNVYVFPLTHLNEDTLHDEIVEYNLFENIYRFSFSSILNESILFFVNFLIRLTIQDIVNKGLTKNGFKSNLKLAYFSMLVKKKNIDLIHAHFDTQGLVAKKIGRLVKLPYSLTAHATDIYRHENLVNLKENMDGAEIIITISEYNKEYLEKKLNSNNKIEVVHCGIDTEKFKGIDYSHNINRDRHKIKLLTVSRLAEKKGLKYFIEAIPIVIKKIPNIELNIIGSGPLGDKLKIQINKLNIEEYVNMVGDLQDKELKNYYNESDVFVLPCVITNDGDRDGIPVSMMEAMAMELPVISTKVSGIPELVSDNSGILVNEKDVEGIGSAIIELCLNRNFIEMGKNGRKIVEMEYDIKKQVSKLEKIFLNIVNKC